MPDGFGTQGLVDRRSGGVCPNGATGRIGAHGRNFSQSFLVCFKGRVPSSHKRPVYHRVRHCTTATKKTHEFSLPAR